MRVAQIHGAIGDELPVRFGLHPFHQIIGLGALAPVHAVLRNHPLIQHADGPGIEAWEGLVRLIHQQGADHRYALPGV